MKNITVGAVVRYAPNYCEEGEENLLHVVVEAYNDVDKYHIETVNGKKYVFCNHHEWVTGDMIEIAGAQLNK